MTAQIQTMRGWPVTLHCCTAKQLALWAEAAKIAGTPVCLENFCADCEVSFRLKHAAAGTCAAHAGVA